MNISNRKNKHSGRVVDSIKRMLESEFSGNSEQNMF